MDPANPSLIERGVGSTGLGPKGQARQQDSDATDSKEVTGTPKMSSQNLLYRATLRSEEVRGRTAAISKRPKSFPPVACLPPRISARTMARLHQLQLSRVGRRCRGSHQPSRANPTDLGPQDRLRREEGKHLSKATDRGDPGSGDYSEIPEADESFSGSSSSCPSRSKAYPFGYRRHRLAEVEGQGLPDPDERCGS